METRIVEEIRRLAAKTARPEVVLGIGDDCAVYRPKAGEELVFTTDLLVEDVHFRRETHSPADLGHKVLARGLSDIAAMGASPRFCCVSAALPGWVDQAWRGEFFRSLVRLCRRTGTQLAGGDLSRSALLMCDIVVCGAVKRGETVRRDGARAGDRIYVSGRLGGSAFGLATGSGPAWKRHLRPQPRLALGSLLRSELHATAAMDLSDGLSLDLHRLCVASGVSAELSGVPTATGATLEQALHGGEDYELLFTVPEKIVVPRRLGGSVLTNVGRITKETSATIRYKGELLPMGGWDHFQGTS